MMIIPGRVVRKPMGPDTFSDLLPAGVSLTNIAATGLTFDADLDPATVAAVWARMESTDDADQADRAVLRAKRDAVLGNDPVAEAVRSAINYQLGEMT